MRVALLSKALISAAYRRKCALIAADPRVAALAVFVPPAWGSAQFEPGPTDGYALTQLPLRFNGNFHLHHYPTLARELARFAPDIVHIDEEPYNVATWLALGDAARVTPRARRIWFSWQNLNRAYPPPFRWIEAAVLRTSHAGIVGNSESERVWRAKGFRGALSVIPQFGVDEIAFAPAPDRELLTADDQRLFTVGFAGRLIHDKGIDVLLSALRHAPGVYARILGDGDARAALEAQAAATAPGRVTFLSGAPSSQMPAFYRSLDALVLPSRTRPNWKEQFGRVLIEAMACGVPVIGSDSGEIPNVIGNAGMIFREDDAAQLADMLQQLAAAPDLRADLAARGRARVLAQYTMARIAAATVDAYLAAR
jgi:glycosyltransferase involved in cell wall biosynthesis